MDYVASIDDCVDVEIKIEDVQELERKVRYLKKWDSDKAHELQENIQKSVNKKYELLHMSLGLNFQKTIYITVNKI